MSAHFISLVLTVLFIGGCASAPVAQTSEFCDRLGKYARDLNGAPGSVTLGRGGAWMVDHVKFCKRADSDLAGGEFCNWLMENTSTEFMEANINSAISCLQGQKIRGYIGNTGVKTWTGKMVSFSPKIDAEDVEVEIEYSVQYFESADQDDFLKISISLD